MKIRGTPLPCYHCSQALISPAGRKFKSWFEPWQIQCGRCLHPTRKNALFAGHEVGAENWALLASIVATCKLNDVNPVAYLADTLDAIINGHPQSKIEDLMPWRFRKTSSCADSEGSRPLIPK